jgi:hypothetical protein
VKYWEIIADNLSKAGWSWGCVSAIESNGRTIFIADAHRDDGKRFIVRADEKLTAFLELESTIRASGDLPRQAGEIYPKLAGYNEVSYGIIGFSLIGQSTVHPIARLREGEACFGYGITIADQCI